MSDKEAVVRKLQQYETRLTNAKSELDRLEGMRQSLLSRLSSEFGIATSDDAIIRLNSISKEIEELELSLEGKMLVLDTKFQAFTYQFQSLKQ